MADAAPQPAPPSPPGGVDVDVSVPCRRWTEALPGAEALCRDAAQAAFAAAGADIGPAEASVVLADDGFQRSLNREYRNTDSATNVLAFPAAAGDGPRLPAGAPTMLGDVVIAFETAAAEAADENKPLAHHLSHLVVHGMLHLLGHDHQTAPAADAMERLEAVVLAGLHIADPYAADGSGRNEA